jgi:hypothetical protein
MSTQRHVLVVAVLLGVASISGCKCGGGSRSCPYVYLWNGSEYRYYTDLAGSVLGAGVALFKPDLYDGGVFELGDFSADAGLYKLKVRETIQEADYFDKAELIVVDVAPGHQVLNQWSFTSQIGFRSPRAFFTVKDPRPPISAVDRQGRDVLDEVSRKDEVPLRVKDDQLSSVVVDFGPLRNPQWAKLVLTAWSHYDDLEQAQKPPYSGGTTIETPDERGEWVVRRVFGKNPGDRRSWVIDLAGLLTESSSKLRITMAHQPIGLDVLDQVLLDDSEPAPLKVTRVRPALAELRFGGSTNFNYTSLQERIHSDDSHNELIEDSMMYGRFTRYGDVRPLLESSDDRFVIMAHGDELALEFQEPERTAGTARWVFLEADVFYSIKYSVKEALLSDSVEPLPFHGMKSYPYPAEQWKYRDDASYREYLDTWNTRLIARP